MIFPYREERRNGKSVLLPQVPVRAFGADSSRLVDALIDSGAEHNLFGLEVARKLRISLENEQVVEVLGIGGAQTPGFLVPVELQLGRHRWAAPVIFSEAVRWRGLLGQAGFFQFFTVTFRYSKLEMDIRRVRG